MNIEHWMIRDAEPGAAMPAIDEEEWVAATAPGDTFLALHQAGRLPDPLRDENEAACAWVEGRDWWWTSRFTFPPAGAHERLVLVFEGLDTHATIWLDDEWLGSSANMFLPARFDVTERVRAGVTHRLAVRFQPNDVVMAGREAPFWPFGSSPVAVTKRNLVRKAQFGWGWDFAPRLLTVGLWRPVRLERRRHAVLADVALRTRALHADRAEVEVELEVDAFDLQAPLSAELTLTDLDGHIVARAAPELSAGATSLRFDVLEPRLWWTADLGDQPLYTLDVTLRHGVDAIDQRQMSVGLRTIALDTSPDPDEPGAGFFRFILNGQPLFARGANWVPASPFVGALQEQDVTSLLERAAAGNMNMIRIWGGGIYEFDAFHDACDRLGLLVWQDFMFACAPYPDDEAFIASARAEVAHQVRRLRHRPSMALWCGNNECQLIQDIQDHLTQAEQPTPMLGSVLFEQLMPEIVGALDPSTPYRPGSPFGGANANSMRVGDEHNWTVWHGIPPVPGDRMTGAIERTPQTVAYGRYVEDSARFVSEFGIQAAPALATLERWVEPDSMALGNAAFLNRIKDKPPNKVDDMLVTTTGLPQTLQQYVDFTQLTQAEGLKFGIEHFRRRMPHCSGALLWQLNDCWPGISWSLIDHDRTCKAGYFAVKRAYAALATSFRRLDDGSVELWATQAGTSAVRLQASIALVTLAGDTCWREDIEADVAAYTSRMLWRVDAARLAAAPDRVLTLRSPQVASDRLFFAPFKDLPLSAASLRMDSQPVDAHTTQVTISCDGAYACFVHLISPDPAAIFSDNHFDLCAGESHTVQVCAPEPSPLELRVLSRIAP